jgi:solute carrier family 35 protein E3
MGEGLAALVEVSLWILLSVVSSTSLILLLKFVKYRLTCQYTITLSVFHFLATWIATEFLVVCGLIRRPEQTPFSKRALLGFLVMCSIVSMNFNLSANSIGFYQMSKLCCIPYMIIRNVVFKRQRYPALELVSLASVLIGVGLFSVSDVEVNFVGTLYAIVAITSTAHNQMMTGELQKEFKLNGPELQLAIMPEQFSIGVVCATVLENLGENSFASARFTPTDVLLMLLTCFFAIGVNVSTFQLIGKTSSITYQVVGHAKTVVLLVLGYIFFPSPWESREQMVKAIIGILLALFGVFMYTKVRIDAGKRAAEKAREQPLEPVPLLTREEEVPRQITTPYKALTT